ncbi:putative ATP-dependent RNA helicase TDRD12 [Heteronotia binoei]|uniref:putative ATP-dependent RNA helicase TDRD12 n=1 Tax=Heteronotia binoei TaxID=13085 RepID=UPI00292DA499|nr:putative ATP-dependent RNA helicase TDRD12 [Heteronotia binoei]
MIDVFVLKIENPDCFWVHVKGGGRFVENETEYKKLHEEMNIFYNKSYRGMDEIKPSVLEEGQVCVVYCQELKSWCRAIVKSIISCTDYYLVDCFLVDHAKSVPVKTDKICIALESFMRLPYRAKKFRLYCTKPMTLRVDYCSNNAEIVPANRWDVAAIKYFQNLLNATAKVEAKLCAVEDESFDVYLYVTIKGQKVCVNDDLVAKNFAYYETKKGEILHIAEKQKMQPSLSPRSPSEKINPAFVLWPTLLQAKECNSFNTYAAVSDNAEKVKHENLHETASHNGETTSHRVIDVVVTVPPLEKGITVSVQADEKTESTLHQKTAQKQKEIEQRLDKETCLKLLQFLNPDPLEAKERHDEKEGFHMNASVGHPVVLSNEIDPCTTLETAPLFPGMRKELLRNQVLGPNHIQSYSWPPIARGCDSVIISPENDPLVYLPPLITFLQSRSCYVSLPTRNGPVALIICPGWKKAEQVFELLEIYTRCSRPLHPNLVLLGLNTEEIKSMKLPRGCEVIITTPHNVLRLLECHSLTFLRLCHLVFDEAEVLFSEANEQMLNILEYCKNHFSIEERESAPWQIVAIGRHWNKKLEYLTQEFMNDPYVVITAMEEAAIYGNVQQMVQLCLECDKVSTLLQVLDFTPTSTQKTLVFTSSKEETDTVSKAVESTSIFCLKVQPGIDFDYVVAQWNKKFSSGTHAVLVLTDDCMSALGITDATHIVHFSFPTSPRIFGARLYGMSANFQNSVEKVLSLQQGDPKAKSILLLTEKSACHAAGVLRYLERTKAKIPPELCDFIAGVLEAKEDSKSGQPLCRYLKIFGICKDKNRCPDRHRINLQIDLPRKLTDETLPTAGNVTILPLFIVDATQYFGRIVGKPKDQYATLAEELNEYYKKASNRISVDSVEKLAMCGLQEENSFHRVQVLQVAAKEENCVFYSVHIKYIDEGRSGQVQNYQLLHLPEKFQVLPPQAVEFIVCRAKPIDKETDWHPKVIRHIHQKIQGKPHEAKIILTLENTIWVDPVVRVTRLLDLKTSINEYNVRSEILSTGMGVDNPEHTQELQKLFQNASMAPEKKDLPLLVPLLKCGKSELAVPAEQNMLDPISLSSHGTQEEVRSSVQSAEDDAVTDDGCFQEILQNHCDGAPQNKKAEDSPQPPCKCPMEETSKVLLRNSPAGPEGDDHPVIVAPPSGSQSFYPLIKWFDKPDVTVVKIKLQDVTSHDCKFFPQRIIFSASAGGRFYLADMELLGSILKEKSSCLLKNGEPMIILAKEKEEPWSNLLKLKNSNVTYDFDYLEDSEEKKPFPVGTGPKRVYQFAAEDEEEEDQSSKDSDTDSDDLSAY